MSIKQSIYQFKQENHYCFSSFKSNLFTISLLGRPNVGKSSLFNTLAHGKYAIVDSMPGVTRDRKEIITDILGIPIKLIDTAGIDYHIKHKNESDDLKNKMIN